VSCHDDRSLCKPFIRAELIGSNLCKAVGFAAISATPVLALCRTLLAAGFDPDQSLDAYRGDSLALRIRSIAKAARLRVATHGIGFEPLPECTAGPPITPIAPEGAELGGRR
jgi:hypothetical protein